MPALPHTSPATPHHRPALCASHARFPAPRPRNSTGIARLWPAALLTALAACTTLPPAASPPPAAPLATQVAAPTKPAVRTGNPPPQASTAPTDAASQAVAARLALLGQPDMLLLGEQHDAPEHQRLHLAVVSELIRQHALAAVVLEMADSGHHTRHLGAQASEAQVQQALRWRESAWPWNAYGPAVMAAVAAGVPVLGGNLPRAQNARVMHQTALDTRIPPAALAIQRQAVADGHCDLLPASQITPMTRIQIARDVSMAQTMTAALRPGQTVLLLAGSQHADRTVGVPLHLSARHSARSVRMDAGGPRPGDAQGFDAVWPTAPLPARDHCAELGKMPGLGR